MEAALLPSDSSHLTVFPLSLRLLAGGLLHVGFVRFGRMTWHSWENLGRFAHQKVPFHQKHLRCRQKIFSVTGKPRFPPAGGGWDVNSFAVPRPRGPVSGQPPGQRCCSAIAFSALPSPAGSERVGFEEPLFPIPTPFAVGVGNISLLQ